MLPLPEKRIQFWLFLLVLCAGLFVMEGKPRDSDEYPMLLTTQAICEKGEFRIENLSVDGNPVAADWEHTRMNWQHMEDLHYGDRDIHGNLFSKYGIAASAVFIPFWFLGMFLAGLLHLTGADRMSFILFITGFTMPVLLAISAILIFRIGRFFKYSSKVSAWLALAFTLSSNLLIYGGMFMSEVTQVTFMLMGWYFLFGFILVKKPVHWAFMAGFGYSLMMLTKFADLMYTLPLFFIAVARILSPLYESFQKFSKGEKMDALEFRRNAYGIGALMLGLLIFPIVFYYYNYIRFGDPTRTGYLAEYQQVYIPIYYGLIGFLVSSGTSLFLYFPPAILFFWAIRYFKRYAPFEFWFFVFHAAIQILFYSRLIYWSGFWSWGPRYSLLILPAFLIPVGFLFDGKRAKRFAKPFRRLCYAGFLIQLPVVMVHFNEFIRLMRNTFGEPTCYYQMFYNPLYSPIPCNWWLILSKVVRTGTGIDLKLWGMSTNGYTATKLFFVTMSRDIPSLSMIFIMVAAIAMAGIIYSGLRLKVLLRG